MASSTQQQPEKSKHDVDGIKPMVWKDEPEFGANVFSGLLFSWMQPLFNRASFLRGHDSALQQEDLLPLPFIDKTKEIEKRFVEAYETWKPKKPKSDPTKEQEARLVHSLFAVCRTRFLSAGVIKFFNSAFQFTFPILLNQILVYFEEIQSERITSSDPWYHRYRGYWLSCVLLFFIGCKAITESAYFHKVNRCGFQVKAAIASSIYAKSFRLASTAQQSTTLGEMVNLMQVDATKIEAVIAQIHVLWDGLFQIAGYMTILGILLGWPCLLGLLVMMVAAPVMGIIMGKLFGVNRVMVTFTDERVKTVNEALQGIRCVKMYSWEESFAAEIAKSRDKELECLRKIAYLRGFARAYMTALPTIAAVVTFVVYSYATDRPVTASTLFASLAAFDQLRFPLLFYPMALAQLSQAQVSIGRVAKFLGMIEVSENGYNRIEDGGGKGEILIENTTIYWKDPNIPITKAEVDDVSVNKSIKSGNTKQSDEGELVYPKPVVANLSLCVNSGDLHAVIGRVGCGKSTLCAAILNETVLSEGSKITVKGRVAYVAQSSWILNKSVRENILFGMPFDPEKYKKVIDVCQLTHDLNMLEDGDLTEIGERGINLSGGQKQRISVARAAYADADLIIMDDPLSALDPEVARDLFEECIVGFMKGKARILVTNQLQCLPQCDSVIALGNGRVIEQGTYSDLMNAEGEVQRLLKELEENAQVETSTQEETGRKGESAHSGSPHKKPDDLKAAKPVTVTGKDHTDAKALTTKEEREAGAVKFQVYLKYMKAGGGYLPFAIVYMTFLLGTGVSLLTTVWISLWSADTSYERRSQAFYLGLYSGTAILLGIVTFCRSYLLATFGAQASKVLHANLLISILRAPMSFYDTTPMGRILSRFSKDMHTIDQELSDFLDFVLFMTLAVVVAMATITFASPLFGIALVPLFWFYITVLNYFRQVSRETKRLESLSRSPVYAQFSETLGGLSTIRAYGDAASFISEFDTKLDESTQAAYCNKTADRWLAVRLEMLGALIAGLAGIFCTQIIISNGPTGIGDNSQYASLAGLSLTAATQVTGLLNWVVRSFAQVEAAMNSCERVFHYSENIPQEAAATSAQLQNDHVRKGGDNSSKEPWATALSSAGGKALHPGPEWPNNGTIKLTNLVMRYREETPLVLKGLDVTIRGGERIGVVGRTGSGKSSLFLCLMRIVEPELVTSGKYQPPVMVDDVDVLRVGLVDLRSKFGIIPQNPVLFSGTIRSNMDPFNEYTDEQIMSALEKCGMKSTVLEMTDGLLAPIAEYGSNLSQGQRQLLCMGRSLLKKCRILLLDEATSSVDFETDREIQRTLRQAFQGSTVLTIAHRVDTIMDSDKILVMKDGVAAEFAAPQVLLADENSLFSEIVRHGEVD